MVENVGQANFSTMFVKNETSSEIRGKSGKVGLVAQANFFPPFS